MRNMYKPRTSEEITIYRIELSSKKLRKGLITLKEAGLNKWFTKLKGQNIGMWEEMYPEYISMVKELYHAK